MRLLAGALAAAAVLLVGCGGGSGTESAETATTKTATTKTEATTATLEKELYGAEFGKACTRGGRPPDNLNIALDGQETPETAGILMAIERGYFDRAGLEVNAITRLSPISAIPGVFHGYEDVAITHEPEAVLAREKGAPLVILGSLIPQPTAALIWLKKSKIDGIADLKGKTIGIPGLPFQELFLRKALAQGGLAPGDVQVEAEGYKLVQELVSGHTDAILGRSNLQGAELEARGLDPVIAPLRDLGSPAYDELVLVARAECVTKMPRTFRDFLSALARGTTAAVENPGEAVRVLTAAERADPETSRKAMEAQLKATLPLIAKGGGAVSRAQLRRLEDWMYEEGMLQRKVPLGALLTHSH